MFGFNIPLNPRIPRWTNRVTILSGGIYYFFFSLKKKPLVFHLFYYVSTTINNEATNENIGDELYLIGLSWEFLLNDVIAIFAESKFNEILPLYRHVLATCRDINIKLDC